MSKLPGLREDHDRFRPFRPVGVPAMSTPLLVGAVLFGLVLLVELLAPVLLVAGLVALFAKAG